MLFKPYKLKNITLRNRIAMAPMTRSQSPAAFPLMMLLNTTKEEQKQKLG
jgi:2,4-dienoyl-CoA reductase-like NADH-dependent reductase (Old Yellow Enzyme family)